MFLDRVYQRSVNYLFTLIGDCRDFALSHLSSHNINLHRVIVTDLQNSNKMADVYQPRKYTTSIEQRSNNKSFLGAAMLLYCFHFDFRYVTLVRYIYIIRIPTRNNNNEFILEFILREIKMADFERRQFEIGLEFVR